MSDINSHPTQRAHIAFCIPKMVIGGVDFVFARTLDALVKTGKYDITVIFSMPLREPYFIEWFREHPQIKTLSVFPYGNLFEDMKQRMRIFPLKQLRKLTFSLYKNVCRRKFRRMAQKFDLFIDYSSFGFPKELHGIARPKITWIHGSINYFNNNNFGSRLADYDRIVCLSRSITDDLRAQYPAHAEKFVHIYNPIDHAAVANAAKTAPAAMGKFFCAVSRMDHDKDISTIIHAFSIFWNENARPDVKLVLIGDGPTMAQLKNTAAQTDAASHIIFAGKIPRPFGYMRASLGNILSSFNEGLPTVLIEGAAVGALNISSDCKSGPRELLMNGDAGLLFEPGNIRQLAQIMGDVYAGRIPRDKMIAAGTIGLNRFDQEKIIPQIEHLIDSMLK